MRYEIVNIAAYEIDDFIRKNSNIFIIDVRTNQEYKAGHIRGAVNIPYEKLQNELKNTNNDTIVLVYCSRGGRSMRAAKILYYKGYKVVNVVGGLKEYNGKNIIK